MHNLYLQEGERIIVHRGVSAPICPIAEQGKVVAHQIKDGFSSRIAGLLYGVQKADGELGLRLHAVSKVAVKKVGEPNALINIQDSLFRDWWCHVVDVDGIHFGLVGRPNRRKLGGRYEINFPHLVSTTVWSEVLKRLPEQVHEKDYKKDVRAVKYPNFARAFDGSRSGIEPSYLDSI